MKEALAALRASHPLLHCISNFVTARDCANLALSLGAAPVMARAEEEVAEIAASSAAVVLNTGTPDSATFSACRAAGRTANRLGIPVVLDPVGAGGSSWRRSEILSLLEDVHPAILRLNAGEAAALLGAAAESRGVDDFGSADAEAHAAALAEKTGAAVLLSGKTDFVTDGARRCAVTGGSERMRRVTGAGCMLSVLCGAFCAAEPDPFQAACLAARFWKRCAEEAEAACRGDGSFRAALFDAAGNFTGGTD